MNEKEIKKALKKLLLSPASLDGDKTIHLYEGNYPFYFSPVFLCKDIIKNIRLLETYNLNYFYSDLTEICPKCSQELEFLWDDNNANKSKNSAE